MDEAVRVVCRFRPFRKGKDGASDVLSPQTNPRSPKGEDKSNGFLLVHNSDQKSLSFRPGPAQGEKTVARSEPYLFTFDKIYGAESTQDELFETVARDTVSDILKGYNGTIFAYGQTGSGKTHTMFGPGDAPEHMRGIIPRAVDALFKGIEESTDIVEVTIKCSFLEIYKENIRDLLNPKAKNLKIRENPTGDLYVQGLMDEYCSSQEEIMELIHLGEKSRKVASTNMNDTSSRSHSLFILVVSQKHKDGTSRISKLNLADLAGSERVRQTGATGETLEEAKKINQSLSSLGNCISALTDSSRTHVPFRDSTLTFLLKDSLGGNCKTTLVVCCSAEQSNAYETLSTLRFAQRAKRIKNTVYVNKQLSVEQLTVIVNALRKELAKAKQVIATLKKKLQEGGGKGSTSVPTSPQQSDRDVIPTSTATNRVPPKRRLVAGSSTSDDKQRDEDDDDYDKDREREEEENLIDEKRLSSEPGRTVEAIEGEEPGGTVGVGKVVEKGGSESIATLTTAAPVEFIVPLASGETLSPLGAAILKAKSKPGSPFKTGTGINTPDPTFERAELVNFNNLENNSSYSGSSGRATTDSQLINNNTVREPGIPVEQGVVGASTHEGYVDPGRSNTIGTLSIQTPPVGVGAITDLTNSNSLSGTSPGSVDSSPEKIVVNEGVKGDSNLVNTTSSDSTTSSTSLPRSASSRVKRAGVSPSVSVSTSAIPSPIKEITTPSIVSTEESSQDDIEEMLKNREVSKPGISEDPGRDLDDSEARTNLSGSGKGGGSTELDTEGANLEDIQHVKEELAMALEEIQLLKKRLKDVEEEKGLSPLAQAKKQLEQEIFRAPELRTRVPTDQSLDLMSKDQLIAKLKTVMKKSARLEGQVQDMRRTWAAYLDLVLENQQLFTPGGMPIGGGAKPKIVKPVKKTPILSSFSNIFTKDTSSAAKPRLSRTQSAIGGNVPGLAQFQENMAAQGGKPGPPTVQRRLTISSIPSREDLGPIMWRSVLWKKPVGFTLRRSWQRRLVVLRKTRLEFYHLDSKDPDSWKTGQKGNTISLEMNGFVDLTPKSGKITIQRSKEMKYSFDIITTKQEHNLHADTEEDANAWVDAIQSVVELNAKTTAPLPSSNSPSNGSISNTSENNNNNNNNPGGLKTPPLVTPSQSPQSVSSRIDPLGVTTTTSNSNSSSITETAPSTPSISRSQSSAIDPSLIGTSSPDASSLSTPISSTTNNSNTDFTPSPISFPPQVFSTAPPTPATEIQMMS